jgi:ABC-type antimicrobial peptide transport system permease subunit
LTNEIGIRIALGARRSLASLYLYGLGPRDVSTVMGASALMLAVALGAGLLPANRAARLEALSALRRE